MLKLRIPRYYKVKRGQTLNEIAVAFCVSEYLLARENGLNGEPEEGSLLCIPSARGNAYVAQAGDGKKVLCGSEERYGEKNGTDVLYPGMRVIL